MDSNFKWAAISNAEAKASAYQNAEDEIWGEVMFLLEVKEKERALWEKERAEKWIEVKWIECGV